MPIIQRHALKVCVVVDGKELPEHDDPKHLQVEKMDDGGLTTSVITKYIECASDTEFSVTCSLLNGPKWLQKDSARAFLFSLYVDGLLASEELSLSTDEPQSLNFKGFLYGKEMRRFRFKALEIGKTRTPTLPW